MWRKGKGRFDIGLWSKKRKESTEEIVNQSSALKELNNQVNNIKENINQIKLKRGLLENEKAHLPKGKRKYCIKPSTASEDNTDELKGDPRVALKRRRLTLEKAEEIHGGLNSSTKERKKECLDGLWHTFVASTEPSKLKQYIGKSKKVTGKVIPQIVNNGVKSYENSIDNIIRSLFALYEGGILSKRKYNAIRSRIALSFDLSKKKRCRRKFMNNCYIPKLTSYKKLSSFINSVDIGELKPFPSAKGIDTDEDNSQEVTVNGCYRPLEDLLLRMADLYLYIDKQKPFLEWFGNPKGSFVIAIGADGAPFGRENEATSWLVSFLNIGDRICSCNENMLLAGANCKEDHACMNAYAKLLRKEIEDIQKKTYIIQGIDVNFVVEMLPLDMKFLASISGELNNAASYFSSFANISQHDKFKRGCTFGDKESTYKPWNYEKRLKDVQLVKKFKATLTQKQLLARTKVTEYIANTLKSRQEFEPFIGPIIDKAVVEPLHLLNNNWQFLFMTIFDLALGRSAINANVKHISKLSKECPFKKFLIALKHKVKAKRLYKRILKWFRDNRSQRFSCRFTGEETELCCKNFWALFSELLPDHISIANVNLKLIGLFYMAILLRDLTSLISRITDFKLEHLLGIKDKCNRYFNTASLLSSVTPSLWTLGYIAPVHAEKVFNKFHTGLGINSMQGREAKHQRLKEYSINCPPSVRWSYVFRHEYMTLFWLRLQNPLIDTYKKGKRNFIPSRVTEQKSCYCGAPLRSDEAQSLTIKCKLCSSDMFKLIEISAKNGEFVHELKAVCNSTKC